MALWIRRVSMYEIRPWRSYKIQRMKYLSSEIMGTELSCPRAATDTVTCWDGPGSGAGWQGKVQRGSFTCFMALPTKPWVISSTFGHPTLSLERRTSESCFGVPLLPLCQKTFHLPPRSCITAPHGQALPGSGGDSYCPDPGRLLPWPHSLGDKCLITVVTDCWKGLGSGV